MSLTANNKSELLIGLGINHFKKKLKECHRNILVVSLSCLGWVPHGCSSSVDQLVLELAS